MKTTALFAVPLAAALMLPAMAQQSSSQQTDPASPRWNQGTTQDNTQTTTQTQTTDQNASQPANSDQNLSAHQPLQPETRQGFWGKINPFARKKYVQRQLSPVRNRVNELDELTASNSKAIKDVDARAQQGIREASDKANLADQHAVDAGNRAQQANQTATQASNRLNTVEQVVGSIDQYQPASQTEIRLRPGQTKLSTKAQAALDDMTANLANQNGYIIEVQGFSATRGQAGIQSSQAMADATVRHLVEKDGIPVYRIFTMGMGNAKVAAADGQKPAHGNRVEVTLLKNSLDQLASAQTGSPMGTEPQSSSYPSGAATQSGSYQSAPASGHPYAQPAPSNNNSNASPAPANTQPPQPQQ